MDYEVELQPGRDQTEESLVVRHAEGTIDRFAGRGRKRPTRPVVERRRRQRWQRLRPAESVPRQWGRAEARPDHDRGRDTALDHRRVVCSPTEYAGGGCAWASHLHALRGRVVSHRPPAPRLNDGPRQPRVWALPPQRHPRQERHRRWHPQAPAQLALVRLYTPSAYRQVPSRAGRPRRCRQRIEASAGERLHRSSVTRAPNRIYESNLARGCSMRLGDSGYPTNPWVAI